MPPLSARGPLLALACSVSGRPWAGPLLAGVVAALVVLICSWPVVLHPGSHIIGATQADFYGIAFGMDHLARHLMAGSWPPMHTTQLEFPTGTALMVTDLPEMIVLVPVTRLFGPTVAFNILQLMHHALAASAAWWCARVLGLAPAGRAVTALAFAFAPALVGTTFNQNPDVSAWYWVPLAMGFAGSARGWRRAAAAGACAGLAAWFSPYAAVMAGVAMVLALPGRDWRRWAAAVGTAALVGGGGALLAWWSVKDPSSAVHKPGAALALHGSAVLDGLLVPWPQVHTNLEWEASRIVHDGYLGVSLLIAGVAGFLWSRRWRWMLLAALAVLMAVGPVVEWPGVWRLHNPLWTIGNRLGMARLWQYHRYAALALLALGLGAGFVAQRLGRWGWGLVVVVALDLLVVTGAWQRLGAAPAFDDGACALLESLPEGAVYDLPPGSHELWLYGAACHGRPVASGINRLHSRYLGTVLEHSAGDDPAKRLAVLKAMDFRYLVFHPDAPLGVENDPMVALAEGCTVACNDAGVLVMDLQACALDLPELDRLPKPRDPARPDLRGPRASEPPHGRR